MSDEVERLHASVLARNAAEEERRANDAEYQEWLRETVAKAPPLNPSQVATLRRLGFGGDGNAPPSGCQAWFHGDKPSTRQSERTHTCYLEERHVGRHYCPVCNQSWEAP